MLEQGAGGTGARTLRQALTGDGRDTLPAESLYIHVPFCFHKCHYCDFYSFVDSKDRQGPFVEALLAELAAQAPLAGTIRTIFVGGGTPSLLRVDLWERLLGELPRLYDIAPGAEFTVECNPETVTPALMTTLRRGCVTRVSIGAQSFDPRHLRTLERWHDPANVGRALALAADAGIERRSIDLIYAIPGQTFDDWRRDLETALALDPGVEHLSCYALTYEPNTAMTKRLSRGEFAPAPDDLEVRMYEHTVEALRSAGLHRYEVSNFAREGAECAHNLAYWRHEGWLACGPSASGHLLVDAPPGEPAASHRWKNLPKLDAWTRGVRASEGFGPIVDHEAPDPKRLLSERIMLGLRIRGGLDQAALLHDAKALGVQSVLEGEIVEQRMAGLLRTERGRLELTDRGYLFADGVAAALMGAAASDA